ncbi:UNVERIFIED_CONTAM: hypothetical protein FKN15_005087 [Acipenser sinensis]
MPAKLPGWSVATGSSPQLAPERAKGLGGRGYQGFGRGVSAGAPSLGTGARWGYPRAAAVSDRGLARTPYRRARSGSGISTCCRSFRERNQPTEVQGGGPPRPGLSRDGV